MRKSTSQFSPETFAVSKAYTDEHGGGTSFQAIIAWNGQSTPVVSNIPAGVVVTYEGTEYTGTLAASSSTTGKMYLVHHGGSGKNIYDEYITVGEYSWEMIGTTQVDLTGYVAVTEQSFTTSQKAQARTNIGASDFSGSYTDLTDKPTLAEVATTGNYSDLINTPTLSTVATSGSYNDLTNKPTAATTSTDGLMASTDKTKLDGIATGAEVNVQSDWNVTDTTADAYIANKPTIRNVPESTTADAGKVLTVEADGTSDWETPTGGGGTDTVNYLTFTAQEANATIAMSVTGTLTEGQAIEYSTDRQSWQTFIIGTTTITFSNAGDYVCFRGDNTKFSQGTSDYITFVMTGKINASGSVMTLIDKKDIKRNVPYGCFCRLFKDCQSLKIPPDLPANGTIGGYAYFEMFSNTRITRLPKFPKWVNSADSMSFSYMFYSCFELLRAEDLPIAKNIYSGAFNGTFINCSCLNYVKLVSKHLITETNYQNFLYQTNSGNNDQVLELCCKGISLTNWSNSIIPKYWKIISPKVVRTAVINVEDWDSTTKTCTKSIDGLSVDSDERQKVSCSFLENSAMKSAKPWFSCSTRGNLTIECQGDIPTSAVNVQVVMEII